MTQQQTKAITVAGKAQQALDEAQIDPRLLMAAKAIQLMAGQDNDGNPKITGDMAIAAAMYQAGTGQLLGRDFYVNEKVGRMEGYRGVARDANERGVGEVQIKYRPLTAQEAEDHEIQPGDTAVACEVYQLRAWNMAQRMGQRYEPIVGIGVIRKVEKYDKKSTQRWDDNQRRYVQLPESNWRQATLEGGMTWRKKAQNRAYKDALRHTPGMPASPEEVIADAAVNLDELPPEAARLTMEQAHAWVEQHGNGPDWDAVEGKFVEQPHPQPTNGQQVAKQQPAPVQPQTQASNTNGIWSTWKSQADAVKWAIQFPYYQKPRKDGNGTEPDYGHVTGSIKKVCTDSGCPERDVACWAEPFYSRVMGHVLDAQAAAQSGDIVDADGWQDVDEHGVDVPLFS